jgi:hypothetical protein
MEAKLEANDPPDLVDPPPAPELPRRVRLYRPQWIGLPLLMLVPVLAVLNVFGESRKEARAAGAVLELRVEYPTRVREGQRTDLRVHVRNVSDRMLDTVALVFDAAYLDRFESVAFTPGAQDGYRVEFLRVLPGEEGAARVEVEAADAWSHSGSVVARAGGAEVTRVQLRTFVFP